MPLDPEYEMTRPRVRISNGNARSNGSDEGEIRVTQGFVSVAMRRGSSQLTLTEYPQGVKGDCLMSSLRVQLLDAKKQLLMRYPRINHAEGGKGRETIYCKNQGYRACPPR